MKKFITTLKNIWKITELRQRILFTMGMLAVYRFGSFVTLPGVIPEVLERQTADSSPSDLLGLINVFTGGAFNQAAVFALGIMPYITASIIIQLLGFAVPYFQRLQQREGESGRKKLNQITRLLTVAITLVQGGGYLTYIKSLGAVDTSIPAAIFWFSNIIILATGTVFAMWLGERITDRGIGNGVSLLITVGIIATLPVAFVAEVQSQAQQNLILFVLEMAALYFVVAATVMIVMGVRRIPIQFAKRMVGRGDSSMPVSGVRDYIPIKVNASGVMPIIFAQALMFLPATVIQALAGPASDLSSNTILRTMSDPFSTGYNVVYFVMVVLFTYVYTALVVNPKQYAEYLKRQNAFIPGIKPGSPTADFIDAVTTRITLPGSIFLGFIAILPAIIAGFGVSQPFAMFFGGTSLLILVAVVLDTMQQIESYLLMRRYDGLVKSGKVKGRSGVQGIGASM